MGVEIAAEILEEQPGKRLTLVHSGPALLEATTEGPRRYAEAFLRGRGAKVLLGQRAECSADADLTLACHGYRIDTSYLQNWPGVLDSQGRVQVGPSLQMSGTTNVFAAGDITALPEPKLGMWAGKHAETVIANLRTLMKDGSGELRTYRPATGSQVMLVTLGRRHGAGHLPFGDFSNPWLARRLKSQDMFVGKYRKRVGLAR